MIDIEATFEKYSDKYLTFNLIENPLHARPDICAFLLLDKLLPGPGRDIITAAEHDIIYPDIDVEKLAEVASEDDILMLVQCGVHYDTETDCLALYA